MLLSQYKELVAEREYYLRANVTAAISEIKRKQSELRKMILKDPTSVYRIEVNLNAVDSLLHTTVIQSDYNEQRSMSYKRRSNSPSISETKDVQSSSNKSEQDWSSRSATSSYLANLRFKKFDELSLYESGVPSSRSSLKLPSASKNHLAPLHFAAATSQNTSRPLSSHPLRVPPRVPSRATSTHQPHQSAHATPIITQKLSAGEKRFVFYAEQF